MGTAFQVIVCIKTNSKDVRMNHPDWLGLMDLLSSLVRNSVWKQEELALARRNNTKRRKESK